ncbi:MAG: type II toxin-antitoxin system RelE/ParE family toxin [Xanthomonadales bacterium]|nr:type II toxin-antitoxin system RelE/ParE family toxin [Xanthomonadales bacterium]MDZ4117157.1 type II toxin-antitoxin system RelE/ParE family toxin [Xanthomonadaceae bacterium]MDZ4378813.1 type II toxin-antitoxin system RelE/ParE family toxin [Xanthomonadaceae bacterium]
MKLVYSAEAVADLVRLRAFIAEIDPSAAARIAANLISRVENIRRFPEIGRGVAQAPEPHAVREVVFGKYMVRYTVHAAAIVILRIWHHYENRGQSI